MVFVSETGTSYGLSSSRRQADPLTRMAWVKGCNPPSDTFRESPGHSVSGDSTRALECQTLAYRRPVTRDYLLVSDVGVAVPRPWEWGAERPGQRSVGP